MGSISGEKVAAGGGRVASGADPVNIGAGVNLLKDRSGLLVDKDGG